MRSRSKFDGSAAIRPSTSCSWSLIYLNVGAFKFLRYGSKITSVILSENFCNPTSQPNLHRFESLMMVFWMYVGLPLPVRCYIFLSPNAEKLKSMLKILSASVKLEKFETLDSTVPALRDVPEDPPLTRVLWALWVCPLALLRLLLPVPYVSTNPPGGQSRTLNMFWTKSKQL